MNRVKSVSLWLLLACCSLPFAGCLTTYDPEAEEFVTGCDPSAAEVCNGVDDNCNEQVDEGCDDDMDGYCDASLTRSDAAACQAGDCDDTSARVNPGATEACSGVDESCNEQVDEGCDDDMDGYCEAGLEIVYSSTGALPAVCSAGIDDCDDDDAALTSPVWYADTDLDGAGDDATVEETCTPPAGYVASGGDCDDSDAERTPGADEVCDGKDNDCDETVDEEATDAQTFYADTDEDTFGDPAATSEACEAPSGYVGDATDCDDTHADAYPGATEVCDGYLNDCAAATADAGCNDDGDAYCDAAMTTVGMPAVCSAGGGDCADDDGAINPGAAEVCSPVDLNCDAQPGALAIEPTVARALQARGENEDMAFNGTTMAVVWAEEGEVTRTGQFAEISMTDLTVLDSVPLTTQERAVFDLDIAWDATSMTYGIAYSALDQTVGTWVVGLIRLQRDGTLIDDTVLDEDTGATPVKVFAGSNTFGVLFDRERPGGSRDMWYASLNIPGGTAQEALVVAQNRSVYDGSYAYLPSAAAIYMAFWPNDNCTTQYAGGAIRISNGGTQVTLQDRNRPSGTRCSLTTLHEVNGELYALMEGAPTAPGNPVRLVAQQLTSSMGLTGALRELGTQSDLLTSDTRGLIFDGTDYIFVTNAYDSGTSQYRARFKRFDASWVLQNSQTTVQPSVSWTPGYEIALASDGQRHVFMDPETENGFFRLTSLGDTGAQQRTREPVSAATYTSPITSSSSNRRFLYDEASQRFLIVQEDPAQANVVQALYVDRTGMTTAPVTIGEYPSETVGTDTYYACNRSPNSLVPMEGGLGCIQQIWNQGQCTQTLRLYTVDVAQSTWTQVDSAVWPAPNGGCDREQLVNYTTVLPMGEGYASFWSLQGRDLRVRITDGMGGSAATTLFADDSSDTIDMYLQDLRVVSMSDGGLGVVFVIGEYDTATNTQSFVLHVRKVAADGTAGPVYEVAREVAQPWSYIELRQADLLGDLLAVTALHYRDTGTGTTEHRLVAHLVDPDAPTSSPVELATTNQQNVSLYTGRGGVAGDRLLVPYVRNDWNLSARDGFLAMLDASGTVTTVEIGEKVDDIYGVSVAGDTGYYAIFLNKPVGGEVLVFDAMGSLITSAQMPFSSVNSLFVEHFVYSGTDFLALVHSGARVFVVDGTCN